MQAGRNPVEKMSLSLAENRYEKWAALELVTGLAPWTCCLAFVGPAAAPPQPLPSTDLLLATSCYRSTRASPELMTEFHLTRSSGMPVAWCQN